VQRIAALRAAGTSVIQVIGGADDLLGPADRVLWIADGEALACGRADAVLGAAARLSAALGVPA
jgi:predicted ABC-class ATPase